MSDVPQNAIGGNIDRGVAPSAPAVEPSPNGIVTRESIAAALAEGRELTRPELVAAVLFRIEDDPSTRDRIMAEIYATTFQLDRALAMMTEQGAGGIMRAMMGFGRKGKRQEGVHDDQAG